MTLKEAIAITNSNILHQRRILTLLSSIKCKKLFEQLEHKPHVMLEFQELFESGDEVKLRYWLSKFIDPDIGDLGIRELKKIAAAYKLPYYYRLTKIELIQGINHARNELKDKSVDSASQQNAKIDAGGWSGSKEIR